MADGESAVEESLVSAASEADEADGEAVYVVTGLGRGGPPAPCGTEPLLYTGGPGIT